MPGAGELFEQQLAASPRAPVPPADHDVLPTFGLPDLAVA
jgi:hypothetical protein